MPQNIFDAACGLYSNVCSLAACGRQNGGAAEGTKMGPQVPTSDK